MNVTIDIPEDVGQALGERSGVLSRTVLEAVAIEAYRAGRITPLQVQSMLHLSSRWEPEAFLRKAEAWNDYTMEDLDRDIAVLRGIPRR